MNSRRPKGAPCRAQFQLRRHLRCDCSSATPKVASIPQFRRCRHLTRAAASRLKRVTPYRPRPAQIRCAPTALTPTRRLLSRRTNYVGCLRVLECGAALGATRRCSSRWGRRCTSRWGRRCTSRRGDVVLRGRCDSSRRDVGTPRTAGRRTLGVPVARSAQREHDDRNATYCDGAAACKML